MLQSNFLLISLSLFVFPLINAFELAFPAGNLGGYWVSNATNVLRWTTNGTEKDIFSVELLNTNSSSLNGNFQIANALPSKNMTASIFLDKVPAGTYKVLFVNPNNYTLNKPELFYTSPDFEIKRPGTPPSPAATEKSDTGSNSSNADSAAATPSTSSSSSSADANKVPTTSSNNTIATTSSDNKAKSGSKKDASFKVHVDALILSLTLIFIGLVLVM